MAHTGGRKEGWTDGQKSVNMRFPRLMRTYLKIIWPRLILVLPQKWSPILSEISRLKISYLFPIPFLLVTCSTYFNLLHLKTLTNKHLTLYVSCIMFQCVDKLKRCDTSYEWSLLSIIWLYMFRTITWPSSGVSSYKLYNALCRR